MDVIIVDDEPKIKNGLVKLISSFENWNVVASFEDATEAFIFICEYPVDLIITDIRMPGITGLELIRKIREVNHEIQIIILSGYSDFTYAQEAIEIGVQRYLTKPTNTKELLCALEAIEASLKQKVKAELDRPDMESSNLIISKTIDYIEQNYFKKITLTFMAKELFISPNYLCRLFKRHTNKNLIEYITEYRMNKAKKLLKNFKYKISEVSEMVGYNDTKYFSIIFKKLYNMTPMEYRNNNNLK